MDDGSSIANRKTIQFYSSSNLLNWTLMSSFGPAGDTSGIWECPDLFEVPIANEPGKSKWVLMHSPSPYMQYFIGEFDGTNFSCDNPVTKIYRPDYGPDYYAAIAYNNLPKEMIPVSIGWVNNWNYANDIPTFPWRGAMSLPRSLSTKKINGEWILLQQPVASLKQLRINSMLWRGVAVEGIKSLPVKGQQFEMDLVLDIGSSTQCGIKLASGKGHEMEIGYDAATKKYILIGVKLPTNHFIKVLQN
jgi:fructan beta-fructosidase